MKRIVRYKLLNFIKFIFVVLFLFCVFTSTSQVSSLIVISNQKGAPSSLTFTQLKSIFRGEQQRWPGGTKITIALMKTNTPAGKTTCETIYGMSSDELNKFWLAIVFQGKAAAPNFFNSASELENFVAQNPGAIGIVDAVTTNGEIKTVQVEGKKL
jgi:ABC-type phosphate transport system substrate-binding protein